MLDIVFPQLSLNIYFLHLTDQNCYAGSLLIARSHSFHIEIYNIAKICIEKRGKH